MMTTIDNQTRSGTGEATSGFLMLAIIVFAAIAPSLLMTAPVVAAQLATQWALGPAQIGNLFMAELGAMSLATLPAAWWLRRVDLRKAALAAGLLFIVGNLLSATASSYDQLITLRMCAGLGGGSLMIICMATAAPLANASRVYGLWVVGQLVLGAVGLQVLPGLFERYGLNACYLSLAILMAVALPLARAFPTSIGQVTVADNHRIPKGKAVMGLLGILCFYLSLSSVWTFISAIGAAAAINASDSGQVLAVATVLGIVGATCASFIGNRLSRTMLLIVSFCLLATAVMLLNNQPLIARFALATLLFKFTWTFVLPFILACIADLDPSGRLMNLTNLVIGGGLAIGPAIAGHLIEASGTFHSTLIIAALLSIASLLLVLASRCGPSRSTQ